MGAGIEPRCVELLDTTCITAVNASLPPTLPPFPLKPHLFFKLSGSATTIPPQTKSLVAVLRASGGKDLRLARTDAEAQQIWDIRKGLVYSLLALFPGSEVIGTDVCVPVSRLAGLIEQYKVDQERINGEIEIPAYGQKKELTSLVVGHVGDGNFHSLMYSSHPNPFQDMYSILMIVLLRKGMRS
jgi:D-lactate dehydrogenase (cytochrome)